MTRRSYVRLSLLICYLRAARIFKPFFELESDGIVENKVDKVPMDHDVLHAFEDLEPVRRSGLPVSVPNGSNHLKKNQAL